MMVDPFSLAVGSGFSPTQQLVQRYLFFMEISPYVQDSAWAFDPVCDTPWPSSCEVTNQ